MPRLPVQLLGVVEWHDFVPFAMNNVDGAVYVGHAVDVWELVKR